MTVALARSAPVSAGQAGTTPANVSLTSKASMSARVRPARFSTLPVAGMTPVSMCSGSSPTTANECSRARGLRLGEGEEKA